MTNDVASNLRINKLPTPQFSASMGLFVTSVLSTKQIRSAYEKVIAGLIWWYVIIITFWNWTETPHCGAQRYVNHTRHWTERCAFYSILFGHSKGTNKGVNCKIVTLLCSIRISVIWFIHASWKIWFIAHPFPMMMNWYVSDCSSRFWVCLNYGTQPNRSFHLALCTGCLWPKRSPLSVSDCCHGFNITARWSLQKCKSDCIISLQTFATCKIETLDRFSFYFMGIYLFIPPIAAKLCKRLDENASRN